MPQRRSNFGGSPPTQDGPLGSLPAEPSTWDKFARWLPAIVFGGGMAGTALAGMGGGAAASSAPSMAGIPTSTATGIGLGTPVGMSGIGAAPAAAGAASGFMTPGTGLLISSLVSALGGLIPGGDDRVSFVGTGADPVKRMEQFYRMLGGLGQGIGSQPPASTSAVYHTPNRPGYAADPAVANPALLQRKGPDLSAFLEALGPAPSRVPGGSGGNAVRRRG